MGDDARLAFIIGHYKSGSTWLLNLLSLHPDICGTGEAHVFRYAWLNDDFIKVTRDLYNLTSWGGSGKFVRHRAADWTRPVRKLWRQVLPPVDRPKTRNDLSIYQQIKLKNQLGQCQSPEEYCSVFFNYLLQAWKPKRYLVEKTPNNIYYLHRVKKLFPEAKLIVVYRDGRDFVISHKYFIENKGGSWNLKKSIETWKEAMQAQIEKAEIYDIFTLSYEDLHKNGAAVTKSLLDYLGLNYDLCTGQKIFQSRNQFLSSNFAIAKLNVKNYF